MTRAPLLLAIFASPHPSGEGTTELLRLLAALVACDVPVRLVEVGPGRGVLTSEAVSDEVDRYVDALAAFDVHPEQLDEEALAAAVAAAPSVLRQGAPDRQSVPVLLELTSEPVSEAALTEAGQVIRVRE